MRYYRDVDYFIYRFEIPHALPGYIIRNSDDTFNVCVNDVLSPERQNRALRHELRHMALEHFWAQGMTITEIELEADEIDDGRVQFGDDFEWVEGFAPERRGQIIALSAPQIAAPVAPMGVRLIPVYSSGEEFLADYVQRATPESLAMLRRAGWRG